MKLRVFPEAFLRAMSAEDRQALGQITAAEAQQRYERGEEKALKAVVVNWLLLQGCWIFTQGMHRKTRGKPGAPDLIVCVPPDGKFFAVELKVRGARLESAQQTEMGHIQEAGGVVVVARCLEDVMRAIWKVRK
jgi:hypothetical protein